jgi:hypothetical protein
MKTQTFTASFVRSVLVACAGVLAANAWAGDHARAATTPVLPKYRQECGSCHVPYPAGMLPATSWRRVMDNLPRHYGTDASLDSATVEELSRWLSEHAGTYRRVTQQPPSQDRITRSPWFLRKHDEVPAATWKLPAVKSAANCTACHAQADQGDFNEHQVRIPR